MPKRLFSIYNLPFFALFAVLVIHILNTVFITQYYSYDEIIVTQISKQYLYLLFDTVSSEPHPPFFYIILKVFSVEDANVTRLILGTFSLFLVSLSLLYAKSKNLLKKYKLHIGLAIFFVSYSFMFTITRVKQDILSFPFLLASFFIFISLIETRITNKKQYIALNVIALLLLSINYLAYFVSFVLLFALYLVRKQKEGVYSIIFQFIVLLIYLKLFGLDQLFLNVGRFGWMISLPNSFIHSISIHLSGLLPPNNIALVIIIVFTLLIINSFSKIVMDFRNRKYLTVSLVLITFLLLFVSYFGKLYVQSRYLSFVFLLLSVFMGWGINRFNNNKIVIVLVTIFFLVAAAGFVTRMKFVQYHYGLLINDIGKVVSEGDKLGLLSKHPQFSFIYSLSFDNSLLVPVSVHSPGIFSDTNTVTKDVLQLSKRKESQNYKEIIAYLHKKGVKNVLFFEHITTFPQYVDPRDEIKSSLFRYCSSNKTRTFSGREMYYIFKNCSFSKIYE